MEDLIEVFLEGLSHVLEGVNANGSRLIVYQAEARVPLLALNLPGRRRALRVGCSRSRLGILIVGRGWI